LLYSSPHQTCIGESFADTGDTIGTNAFGDEFQNSTESLFLFSEADFPGISIEVTKEFNLNKAISIKSYYFTGNQALWTIYSEPSFTGAKTCLSPSSELDEHGFGFTFAWNTTLNVGSIVRSANCATTTIDSKHIRL